MSSLYLWKSGDTAGRAVRKARTVCDREARWNYVELRDAIHTDKLNETGRPQRYGNL